MANVLYASSSDDETFINEKDIKSDKSTKNVSIIRNQRKNRIKGSIIELKILLNYYYFYDFDISGLRI